MSQPLNSLPQQPPFKVTAGLGRTLLISFLILTMVPTILVTIIGTSISLQAAQSDAFNRLGSVADVKIQAIEDWLGERQRNLQAILTDNLSQFLFQDAFRNQNDTQKIDAAAQSLSAELRAYPAFVRFFVVNQAGRAVISTDANLAGQLFTDQPFVARGLLGPYITLIKNDRSGLYDTIVIAAPIATGDQLIAGVLVGEANLDQLSRIVLTGLGEQRSDDSYLVGPDSHFLTQSHYPHKKDSGDVVQTAGVAAALNDPLGRGQSVYNNYIDLPVVGVYRTIPALRIILITEQLTSDAFAGVNQQVFSGVGIGLLALLVAILGSVLVTRRVTQPLIALTQTATRIAGGDLKQSAAVERRDEVGLLAQAFNAMTAQLRTLIKTLEQKVESRTAQLKASFEVGQAATSILDTELLLGQIVNLIVKRFDYYYAAVFMLDAKGKYAVLREASGEAGRTLKQIKHQLEVGGQSMVGTAVSTRQARIALDVGKEAIRFANPLLPLTRSEIALPLIAGDRVLGVLDVQSRQSAAFDESSAEVLQAMANQIAVALLNAESFSRAKQQTRALELLNQLSRDLAAAPSLETISRVTAFTLTELVGPSRFIIALRSADPSMLAVQEFSLDNQPSLSAVQLLPVTNSVLGQSLKNRRTLYLPDLELNMDQYPDVGTFRQMDVQSFVTIPLQAGEQMLGTFSIGQAGKDAFSVEQLAELEQVTAQLAVAIENHQLLERTQDALKELDAVNRRLVGQAWERYAHTSGALSGEWRDAQWVPLPPAVTLPDGDLRLPIRVRGETIGEFSLTSTSAQIEWTTDDITFAQSLIDQVGQTIETARLFEESERLALRERTINDINSRVRQTVKMDTILETAVSELARSLKAARVFARIGGHDHGHDHDQAENNNGDGDHHA